ncbi:MAG: hypothetical protein K0A99_07505 [Desulfoarculaceae bacterium]|nr:hypothetical protein [Desulfoarculaceae bacterium]
MKKSSLLLSNPYLKDPVIRDALLRQTVISSSAIEGVNKTVANQALGVLPKVAGLKPFSRPVKSARQQP